jgi:ferric-chelate reductase
MREARRLRWLFGRVTRVQILLLAALSTYLLIFSFVGMAYKKWVTPVKNMPGVYNTRTTLGPFADRVGLFAYALTPLSILLASRESLLSAVTGIPYHHFNFLHRWVGHVIMLQSIVHTIGWCIVEIKLYQPQPSVAVGWIKQTYMIWGIVALILLLLLWALATPWARRAFGYEFFRKAHWILAMLFIGACWGHWAQLKCFMLPSLLLWLADRGMRLFRTILIHYRVVGSGRGAFTSFAAKVTHFDTDIVRLDLDLPRPFTWDIGQHYYLTFPKGSIWQSHPFTPLSLPGEAQAYLIRAKKGETKQLVQWNNDATPVILTGAYGQDIVRDLAPTTNVLCIAGGTGITFVLPVLLLLAKLPPKAHVQLLWAVRHRRDTEWIAEELARLVDSPHISVIIHTTRDHKESPDESSVDNSSKESTVAVTRGRPDLNLAVDGFLKRVAGPSRVYISGPGGMVTTVREKVATCNVATKVWRGEEEFEVDLISDERLE